MTDATVPPNSDAVKGSYPDISQIPATGKPPAGPESARRAIAVLMAFADHPTMSAREVADAAEIPLPSVYRYLSLLRESGLLLGDENGIHRVSPRVFALSHAAERAESLIDVARPVMLRLAAACNETVQLMRLVGRSVIGIHRIESLHRLRISSEPGHPLPAGRGASGRLLLASLPAEVRQEWLADAATREPQGIIFTERDVAEADERGWATSEEEIDQGIWACAAAIRRGAVTVATLTVLSPLVRAPADSQESLLNQVRLAADEITQLLDPNGGGPAGRV